MGEWRSHSRSRGLGGIQASRAHRQVGGGPSVRAEPANLQCKDEAPVAPDRVAVVLAPDGPVPVLLFTRKKAISERDSEVTVQPEFGYMSV